MYPLCFLSSCWNLLYKVWISADVKTLEQYEDISVFDDFIQKKKKKKRESVRVVGVNWIEKRKELKGQNGREDNAYVRCQNRWDLAKMP